MKTRKKQKRPARRSATVVYSRKDGSAIVVTDRDSWSPTEVSFDADGDVKLESRGQEMIFDRRELAAIYKLARGRKA